MNKTKIEWCDYTFNPVSGCLHGCEYCYARVQTKRFEGFYDNTIGKNDKIVGGLVFSVDEVMYRLTYKGRIVKAAYPYGFTPTFHRYRLYEPQKLKKPQTIFVVSMGDLFGEWVPDEWITEVFRACEKAPQHRYLFLTKNPGRYTSLNSKYLTRDNHWFGATATDQDSYNEAFDYLCELKGVQGIVNRFLSIEPLLGGINLSEPRTCYPFGWVIIGAETGKRKDKIVPQKEWIENIVRQCNDNGIPVFMKDSLLPIMGEENMLREYPFEGNR